MSRQCKKCVWLWSQTGETPYCEVLHVEQVAPEVIGRRATALGLIQSNPKCSVQGGSREPELTRGETTIRSSFAFFLLIATTFALLSSKVSSAPAQLPAAAEGVQVVEVTAKKYEFNPSPIRVRQGARVQLKITATDHAHGFKISPLPEGTKATDSPGLIFSAPQSCERIEKHQMATIEFVAKTPGTYAFRCCTFCGWHHRAMKGELIVEP